MGRTRGIPIQVYLSQEEYDHLVCMSEKTGRTVSSVVRQLVRGNYVIERPEKEFYILMSRILERIQKMEGMVKSPVVGMRQQPGKLSENNVKLGSWSLQEMITEVYSLIQEVKRTYYLPKRIQKDEFRE